MEDYVNYATKGLRNFLLQTIPTPSTTKKPWRSEGFAVPEEGGEFGAGRVTVSPAYFMQRLEVFGQVQFTFFWLILIQRLQDPIVASASYSCVEVQEWLAALSTTEFFWNAITAAVAPDLFAAGANTISKVNEVQGLIKSARVCQALSQWPSVFSGLEIIANRTTPSHRDAGGAPSHFDLLVSLGRNHEAKLTLPDVQAELDYFPGTMVFISGKVLEHSVGPWINGERLVIAHFMKDKVHNRLGVPRPAFPTQSFFLKFIGRGRR